MAWPIAAAMLAGSAMQAGGGLLGQRHQTKLMHQQMDFEQQQAARAHQTEVADLRAAGLNPILSATGGSGAHVGGVSAPSAMNPLEGAGATFANAAKVAGMEYERNKAEVANINAKTATEAANKENVEWLTNQIKWNIDRISYENEMIRSQTVLNKVRAQIEQLHIPREATKGKIYGVAEELVDKAKEVIDQGKRITLEDVKEFGIPWIKNLGKEGLDSLRRILDGLKSESPMQGGKVINDSTGVGRVPSGSIVGGPHRAGQKAPWSDVEKHKGSESNAFHPDNWKRR